MAVRHETIYIADDEKNIRDVVKLFLESEGYQVAAFENSDDLLAAYIKQPCDLVILDIVTPVQVDSPCVPNCAS